MLGKKNQFLSLGEDERKEMRTATISQAIKGFFTVLFLFYVITEILDVIEREFRYRVHKVFEENNIAIGKPQWISLNKNLE